MKRFAVSLFFSTKIAFSLAGADKFDEALAKLNKEGNKTYAFAVQLLSQAVGTLVMMNEDPTVLSRDQLQREQLGFKAFSQEPCSAVHFQEPAWFVTTAHCFQGIDGGLDRFRQYARISVGKQTYTVDPLSIVLHPKHSGNSNPTQYDVAIFSLRPEQVADFDKTHTPIPLAPEDFWLGKGQLFYLAASGSTNSNEEGWGEGRIKRFKMVSVPKSEQIKGTSRLFVSPSEQIILLATDDGSNGINCLFDSGGAVVGVSQVSDGNFKFYLTGNIARKTGPAGNGQAKCESVDRYVVATDFRFQIDWFAEAIAQSHAQRQEAETIRQEFAARQKELYGQTNPYAVWVPVRKEVVEKIFDTVKAVTLHEKSKAVYEFMIREKKIQEAIPYLSMHSSQKQAVANVLTLIQRPADPFRVLASNQVEGIRDANLKNRFLNPQNGIPARSVRVTNMGDTTVSFQSLTMTSNYLSHRDDQKNLNRRILKPGQSLTVPWPQNQMKPIDFGDLDAFEGDITHVKVDFTLATDGEQRWLKQQEMGREWYQISLRAGQYRADFNAGVNHYNSELARGKKANREYNDYLRDDWTNEYYRRFLDALRGYKAGYHATFRTNVGWHQREVDAYNQKWKTNYGYILSYKD